MKPTLHPLAQQTLVITGASSGIGLATARLAAQRHARLVLTARNAQALTQLAAEITAAGGEALAVPADVADPAQLRQVLDAAVRRFGRCHTWINCAGATVYGRLLEDIPLHDHRRLFDTNYFGTLHGCLLAAEHLRQFPDGGAIINIGSVLSDIPAPLQGPYAASKHAIKALTNVLRMELEAAGYLISLTLVRPPSVNTPYPLHAKSYLAAQPRIPSPLYSPELCARAILFAAEYPRRDVFIGSAARAAYAVGHHVPRFLDKFMEAFLFRAQHSTAPPCPREANALDHPGSAALQTRGPTTRYTRDHSLYTMAALHPLPTAILAVTAALALTTLFRPRRFRVATNASRTARALVHGT